MYWTFSTACSQIQFKAWVFFVLLESTIDFCQFFSWKQAFSCFLWPFVAVITAPWRHILRSYLIFPMVYANDMKTARKSTSLPQKINHLSSPANLELVGRENCKNPWLEVSERLICSTFIFKNWVSWDLPKQQEVWWSIEVLEVSREPVSNIMAIGTIMTNCFRIERKAFMFNLSTINFSVWSVNFDKKHLKLKCHRDYRTSNQVTLGILQRCF